MGLSTTNTPPPIFIVGCGHSGTSILVRILGAHSRICNIPFESNFALKWPKPCENSAKFFSHCETYRHRMDKARWLEKTPSHIFRLAEILDYFPEGKILIMIRDGRDVACSYQDRYGNLEEGIGRWIEDNRAGQSYWNHPNVLVVRYEKLVTEFEKTLREVMAFLGEEFEEAQASYHEEPRYFFTSRIEKPPNAFRNNHDRYRNWQINQPFFDGRGRWQRLTDDEKNLIKKKAGEMLIEYGYAADLNW